MRKPVLQMKLSDVKAKLSKLDQLLQPGQFIQITKKGKKYARIELYEEMDRYEAVLKAIESLPEPKGKLQPVARNFKSMFNV